MDYKEWKEIHKIVKKPEFVSGRCDSFGISEEKYKEYINVPWETFCNFRDKFRRERFIKRLAKDVGIGLTFIFLLFSVVFSIAGSVVYFQKKSLENLTGEQLNYWDVFWAGSSIRYSINKDKQ